MIRLLRTVKPGTPVRAEDLDEAFRAAQRRVVVDGPVDLVEGSGGTAISFDHPVVLGRVTGGNNPYSWVEVGQHANGTFFDVTGGYSGMNTAYEVNGNTSVGSGNYAWMYPMGESQNLGQLFGFQGPGGGAGYSRIQEEGVNLAQRTTINFKGSAITASDDSTSARTNVALGQTPTDSANVVGEGRFVNTAGPLTGGGNLAGDLELNCSTSPVGSGTVVGTGRILMAMAPVTGGGDLSADRSFGLDYSPTTVAQVVGVGRQVFARGPLTSVAGNLEQDIDLNCTTSPVNSAIVVGTGRTINGQTPLENGGDLSVNRTIVLAGLSTYGSPNYVVGVQANAGAWEYKQVSNTGDITITHNVQQIVIGSRTNTSGNMQFSCEQVNAAGSNQATAYPITKDNNNVGRVAMSPDPIADGIILPNRTGARIYVMNSDQSNMLQVYPPVGGKINFNLIDIPYSHTMMTSRVYWTACNGAHYYTV